MLIKPVRAADTLLPKLCHSTSHSEYGHRLFLQVFVDTGSPPSAVTGWGEWNGSEGSAGRAACRIGSAFSIRWVSRSMLLVTKGRGGSSIALMVAHTRSCRSCRSETRA